MQLIKAALCHAAHFVAGGPSLVCVVVIMACTKLSDKIFAVQHSPYAVSKFELGRPSEQRKNGWKQFFLTNKKSI